jgi:hypothetical protein
MNIIHTGEVILFIFNRRDKVTHYPDKKCPECNGTGFINEEAK